MNIVKSQIFFSAIEPDSRDCNFSWQLKGGVRKYVYILSDTCIQSNWYVSITAITAALCVLPGKVMLILLSSTQLSNCFLIYQSVTTQCTESCFSMLDMIDRKSQYFCNEMPGNILTRIVHQADQHDATYLKGLRHMMWAWASISALGFRWTFFGAQICKITTLSTLYLCCCCSYSWLFEA